MDFNTFEYDVDTNTLFPARRKKIYIYACVCVYVCVCARMCAWLCICRSLVSAPGLMYVLIDLKRFYFKLPMASQARLFVWFLSDYSKGGPSNQLRLDTIYQPLCSGKIWHKVNF